MLGKYGVNNLLMATNFLALTHCLVHSPQCLSVHIPASFATPCEDRQVTPLPPSPSSRSHHFPSITCGDEFCLSTTPVMQGTLIERCPHVNEHSNGGILCTEDVLCASTIFHHLSTVPCGLFCCRRLCWKKPWASEI